MRAFVSSVLHISLHINIYESAEKYLYILLKYKKAGRDKISKSPFQKSVNVNVKNGWKVDCFNLGVIIYYNFKIVTVSS